MKVKTVFFAILSRVIFFMKKKIEFFFAWFLDVSLGGLGVPAAFPPPSHRFAPPPPPPAAATSREYEVHQQVKKYKCDKNPTFSGDYV